MKVLIIDGHPDSERLLSHLLDHYEKSLKNDVSLTRINLRDLTFDVNLRQGYALVQNWETDLQRVSDALAECDHLVVGFPLWWGAEPALLKGLLDRVIVPGFAFKYHRNNAFWDRLLVGRSADIIITMDTPPWYLKLFYGDPVMRRWRLQILGFCGFKPIRPFRLGPTRRGAAKRNLEGWERRIGQAAQSIEQLNRGSKSVPRPDHDKLEKAIEDRMS